jgi:tetratricopeptide (TPR) repeat protein
MTRNEALQLLGVSDGQEPEAVRKAYSSLKAALAERITSAATPGLRQQSEQQLARLRQARDLLLGVDRTRTAPSPLSPTQERDLPVRDPIATGGGPGPVPVAGEPEPFDPPAEIPLSLTKQADLPARGLIAAGQILAERYEVRADLGSGGMGAVFAAFDRVRQEEIAVKVLHPHLLADPKARERFLNEARIASNLAHPHIVRVYDVHQAGGLTFLTMERLKGHSLREEIARRSQTAQRFTVEEVRRVAGQLCEALKHAHQQTVHRDIKPENIWLGEDGSVKLMDFGIARLLRPSQFTSTGLALGTAYYMAPEQLRGQEVDYRADQFALGVVLYELLTGEIPQGAIKPPHVLRRSVPSGVSQAVMKALEGRAEDRFVDMEDFRDALSRRGRTAGRALYWMAASATLVVGAVFAATDPQWRRLLWPGAAGSPAPALPAEEVAAKATYASRQVEFETLQKKAEGLAAEIATAAKAAPDDASRALTESLAVLWRKHPGRKNWLSASMESFKGAQDAAAQQSYRQAVRELERAESLLRQAGRWYENAHAAMGSIRKSRQTLDDRLAKHADPGQAPPLAGWTEKLVADVESKLLEEDGGEGLAEARRVAELLPEMERLIDLRSQAIQPASAVRSLAALSDELGGDVAAIDTRIREADTILLRDHLGQARRYYQEVADRSRRALGRATALAEGLLDAGEVALATKKFEDAAAAFDQILSLRPREAKPAAGRKASDPAPLRPFLTRAYHGHAAALCGQSRFDQAIVDCNQALDLTPDDARAYAIRASARNGLRDFDHAIADCEQALRIDPNLARAYTTRAAAYTGRYDYDRAIADCTEAVRIKPGDVEALQLRASAYNALYEFDKAIVDCTEAVRIKPGDARSYVIRSHARREKEDTARALADAEEAIRLEPRSSEAYFARGQAFSSLENNDRAIADYSEAIRLDPKLAEAYVLRVGAYRSKGDRDRASAEVREMIQRLEPRTAEEYYAHGWFFNDVKEYDRAIADLDAAIRMNPRYVDAYYERALSHKRKKDLESELKEYNAVINYFPRNAGFYNRRGNLFHNRGDQDRAIADYSEAIRLSPDSLGFRANRAVAFESKGANEQALGDYNELIRLDPGRVDSWLVRANFKSRIHQYDSAVADCSEAIRLDPRSKLAYHNRGMCLCEAGRMDEGLEDLARAIQIDPKYGVAYKHISEKYLYQYINIRISDEAGFDKAIAVYTEWIRNDPNSAEAFELRAAAYGERAYWDNGYRDKAIADYSEAIRLNPKSASAYKGRGVMRSYNRNRAPAPADSTEAVRDLTEAIRLYPEYWEAYWRRAIQYCHLEQFDQAIADCNEALRIRPQDRHPYLIRAGAYKGKGDTAAAAADEAKHRNSRP